MNAWKILKSAIFNFFVCSYFKSQTAYDISMVTKTSCYKLAMKFDCFFLTIENVFFKICVFSTPSMKANPYLINTHGLHVSRQTEYTCPKFLLCIFTETLSVFAGSH